MAKCDEGYFCQVCGKDVSSITDSDLYLRYVIGELDPEVLHTTPERHLRCNPVLAQFIDDPAFQPVIVNGPMSRTELSADYVRARVELVTQGYQRLQQIQTNQITNLTEYPLPQAQSKYRSC
ncbi:MAG: hypothetical protein AAGA03_04900 [Planctomycetota bacterium]